MSSTPLGKVIVPTPGTPVQVSATSKPCQGIGFQAWYANTGKIFVGNSTMNKTTGAGVYGVIGIPAGAIIPGFSLTQQSPGGLDASNYYLDADNGNEGVLVDIVTG